MWNSPWLMLNCQRLIELWHGHLFGMVWESPPFWGIMSPGLKLRTTSSQGNNVWGFTSRCQRAQDYQHERIRDLGYWNGHATGYPRVFHHTQIWGCNKTWYSGAGIYWEYHGDITQKNSWDDDPQCPSGTTVTYILRMAFIILQQLHQKTAKISGILVNLHLIPDVSMGL